MKTINLIKVFIASPGDIAAKRNEVEETIYRWNIENTDNTKVILMPIRWGLRQELCVNGKAHSVDQVKTLILMYHVFL